MQVARSGSALGRRAAGGRLAAGLFASILLSSLFVFSAAAGTLDRIRETGVVRLGYLTGARPFSYRDEQGKPAGYAVALCEQVVKELQRSLSRPDLRAEYVMVEPNTRFDAVKDGNIDLLCGGGTQTLALREKVSFSIPIFPGGIGVLIRKDAPAKMRAVLEGKAEPFSPRWRASLGQVMAKRVFAVVAKSRAAEWLEHGIDDFALTATIEPIESFDAGLDRVAARRADAVFAEREILLDAVNRSPSAKDLVVLDRKFTYEPLAFALPRTDEDFRLFVDASLSRIYRSTFLEDVYTPVFGKPDDATRQFFLNSAIAE